MFWIFKIFPLWLWWLFTLSGILVFISSYLPQVKPYAFILKILGLLVVVIGIFINGMYYADSTWKAAAAELEAKVAQAELKSNTVNEVIKERIVTKLQIVKVRGEENTKYIDRELVKYDNTCIIPSEFVQVHNKAAEQPK